jgi:predicted nucleic acid-binding protein
VIYFDTAYIAKCYLNEPGAERVRAVAREAAGLASCEIARLELASILLRHVREDHLTRRELAAVRREILQDEQDGVWTWLPVTSGLLQQAADRVLRLPVTMLVRSADALHLACAAEHGFGEIYTNGRPILRAAAHFGIAGIDLLDR